MDRRLAVPGGCPVLLPPSACRARIFNHRAHVRSQGFNFDPVQLALYLRGRGVPHDDEIGQHGYRVIMGTAGQHDHAFLCPDADGVLAAVDGKFVRRRLRAECSSYVPTSGGNIRTTHDAIYIPRNQQGKCRREDTNLPRGILDIQELQMRVCVCVTSAVFVHRRLKSACDISSLCVSVNEMCVWRQQFLLFFFFFCINEAKEPNALQNVFRLRNSTVHDSWCFTELPLGSPIRSPTGCLERLLKPDDA